MPGPHKSLDEMDWTEAAIDRLAVLWLSGRSTKDMGRDMGVSKNSIIGKCHRRHVAGDPRFPKRPSPIKNYVAPPIRQEPRQRRAVQPRPPPVITIPKPSEPPFLMMPPPRPVIVVRSPTPFKSSPCCWPIGEPGERDFRFCGAPTHKLGTPYCREHHDRAYTRIRERPHAATV